MTRTTRETLASASAGFAIALITLAACHKTTPPATQPHRAITSISPTDPAPR